MKKLLSFIVVVCTFCTSLADSNFEFPTVTLSHNGELTFFNNLEAFESAVSEAENGDTIYLSEGEFFIRGRYCGIYKRLSIVGNGYGSYLDGDIYVKLDDSPEYVMDAPLFDGVNLLMLSFRENHLSQGKSEIRRCCIYELEYGGNANSECLYDKCFISRGNFEGNGNTIIQNSKIESFRGGQYVNKVVNCNICYSKNYGDYYPHEIISSIVSGKGSEPRPYHWQSSTIVSSLLNFPPYSDYVYSRGCYSYDGDLFDDNMDCIIDLAEAGYFGEDGTVVGVYGGDHPFSENPSVPSIDTDKSSVVYDAENNKLKVSITVKTD